SHTPTICCYFDAGEIIRALMKIGLNLIAGFCLNTPVNRETFGRAIRLIRGDVAITHQMVRTNGFIYAEDVRVIKGAENDNSFRLIHLDGTWHIFFSFFGGSIGAYVKVPGPSHEEWKCADIVAPMKSKGWTCKRTLVLPLMQPHVQWRNSERVMPSVK